MPANALSFSFSDNESSDMVLATSRAVTAGPTIGTPLTAPLSVPLTRPLVVPLSAVLRTLDSAARASLPLIAEGSTATALAGERRAAKLSPFFSPIRSAVAAIAPVNIPALTAPVVGSIVPPSGAIGRTPTGAC